MTKFSSPPSIPDILTQLHYPQPWQIAALLQDNVVWNSFMDEAFLSSVAQRLARSTKDPAAAELSPAAIALDALGYPGLLNKLRSNPTADLPL